MYGETEVVKYRDEYFECKLLENNYELSNDVKELNIINDVEFEYIETINETDFYDQVWELISERLIDAGERTISDMMEQDGEEDIVNDIHKQVHTLPGLCDKYAEKDIIVALDNSEVYDLYYDRYYLECLKRAFNGYSEEND